MSSTRALALLVLAAFASVATAQSDAPELHPLLKFSASGKFKIMQVADAHYANGSLSGCKDILDSQKPCSDLNTTALLTELIKQEKPDLVIFTGDNIMFPNTFNATQAMINITKPAQDAKVPFMVTFGNHDCEEDGKYNAIRNFTCRRNMVRAINRAHSYSLTKMGPHWINGVATYAYAIADPVTGEPAFAIYVVDSGAYMATALGNVSGYDYVTPEQVLWYKASSTELEVAMGKKIPGGMFMHIPLPEYDSAWACGQGNDTQKLINNPSFVEFGQFTSYAGTGARYLKGCKNYTIQGDHLEGVYSSHVNGGMFSEITARGDVKFITSGHDHINDFCADAMGLKMCYGGGFGYYAYGKAGWARRARFFDININGTVNTYKKLDSWANYTTLHYETFK